MVRRPSSVQIPAPIESYYVSYHGAVYIVAWNKAKGAWSIYHETTRERIKMLQPQHGLGKEEAIDWIERNF